MYEKYKIDIFFQISFTLLDNPSGLHSKGQNFFLS